MAVGDIFQLTHVQSAHGTRITNVHYYKQDDPDGANDPRVDLADAFDASMAATMKAALAIAWSSLCYEIKLVGVTGQAFWKQLSTQGNGTVIGEAMNTATCAVAAQFTATGSRDGTGRMLVAGLPVSYEERNNLNTAGLAAIDTIGDQSVKSIASGGVGFTPGLLTAGAAPLREWILADVRIPLTKLRPRRQSTKC